MPVLMNKGADPRKAAWLFFTDRTDLSAFASAAVEGRFESGLLLVDDDDLARAPKAGSEVPVWLEVETLVPEDVDLDQARGEVVEKARHDIDRAQGEKAGADSGESIDAEGQVSEERGGAGKSADPLDPDAAPSYEPAPAPEGLRVLIGSTTRQAAENYLHEQELDGIPWRPELPGLQMLAQLVELMEQKGNGLPDIMVWHIDAGGIMRMAPAKQVKPMAGNVLKVKL